MKVLVGSGRSAAFNQDKGGIGPIFENGLFKMGSAKAFLLNGVSLGELKKLRKEWEKRFAGKELYKGKTR